MLAKASPPMPHPVGSATVRAIAAATAASSRLLKNGLVLEALA
jgi:hypothetical protein